MHSKPKKRLGQNFLIDHNIRRKIVAACGLRKHDTVLEIGPGRGELTSLIAPAVENCIIVEIDRGLSAHLASRFAGFDTVRLINQNILDVNPADFLTSPTQKIIIVGNIPYYISSPILTYIIHHRHTISRAFLTVQKEFAQRLLASPGSKSYGALSCYIQYYTDVSVLFHIKKTCFSPMPGVDSSFITLSVRDRPAVDVIDEELFFKIIRRSFQQRRKTLKNSLKGLVSDSVFDHFVRTLHIPPNIRPEQLSLEAFAGLTALQKK